MRRAYADLHLRPRLDSPEHVESVVRKASELGFSLIAMSLPSNIPEADVLKLRDLSRDFNVDLASRVDLRPQSSRELISSLRKLRRRFEIISVVCESKSIARQAGKDRRVDLLNFPSTSFRRRFFDKAEAELASNSLAFLEIDIEPLLSSNTAARIRLLSYLRKEVIIAQAFQVPIIISSGASEEMFLRKPQELAALTSLFDLHRTLSIEAVSKNPVTLVKRNRGKLTPDFVAPGVRVVKRRIQDC